MNFLVRALTLVRSVAEAGRDAVVPQVDGLAALAELVPLEARRWRFWKQHPSSDPGHLFPAPLQDR